MVGLGGGYQEEANDLQINLKFTDVHREKRLIPEIEGSRKIRPAFLYIDAFQYYYRNYLEKCSGDQNY